MEQLIAYLMRMGVGPDHAAAAASRLQPRFPGGESGPAPQQYVDQAQQRQALMDRPAGPQRTMGGGQYADYVNLAQQRQALLDRPRQPEFPHGETEMPASNGRVNTVAVQRHLENRYGIDPEKAAALAKRMSSSDPMVAETEPDQARWGQRGAADALAFMKQSKGDAERFTRISERQARGQPFESPDDESYYVNTVGVHDDNVKKSAEAAYAAEQAIEQMHRFNARRR